MSSLDSPLTRPKHAATVWACALAVSTLAGTLAASCLMPFVALAVVAATTLPTRKAVITVAAIWLINQVLGFTLLDFPRTVPTFVSGLALGLGSLAALAVARAAHGTGDTLIISRLLSAFALAFITYELLLFAFAFLGFAGTVDMFTPQIVALVGLSDAIWLALLVALRLCLTGVAPRSFGPIPVVRLAV